MLQTALFLDGVFGSVSSAFGGISSAFGSVSSTFGSVSSALCSVSRSSGGRCAGVSFRGFRGRSRGGSGGRSGCRSRSRSRFFTAGGQTNRQHGGNNE